MLSSHRLTRSHLSEELPHGDVRLAEHAADDVFEVTDVSIGLVDPRSVEPADSGDTTPIAARYSWAN